MPISNSYPKGIPIEDQDLFVGTKASNNRTVNYTAQGVADYLNINSKVSIAGQMSFQFSISPNLPKTISFDGGLGDGTAFSAITQLIVSAIDLSTANITVFLNYLNNSQILLAQQNQPNYFGHYKITGYTQIGLTDFYTLDLEFIGGNGAIGKDQYYDIVSFVLTSGSGGTPTLQQVLTEGKEYISPDGLYKLELEASGTTMYSRPDTGSLFTQVASYNNYLFNVQNDDNNYGQYLTFVGFSQGNNDNSSDWLPDGHIYLNRSTLGTLSIKIPALASGNKIQEYQDASGTIALTSDIPTLTPAALTKTDDTNVTLTLGGTPSTALLQATSLTLGWTGTLADSRIASASTWNAKQNAITTGTTAQYFRGDLSLATFPTIPTVGTWGALNYPTWTTGTPFVKMTAAGTFALDTNTYLTGITSSQVTTALGYTPVTNARTLTINGTTYDLTADRSWTIATSSSPLTTKGDLYTFSTVNARLPVGLDTQVLIVDSTASTGLKWGSNTAATPLGYYGAWQDNVTQTAAADNTGYAMIYRTADITPNGISIVNNGSSLPTRITFANTGIYNIQFSAQLQSLSTSTEDVTIWLCKNGVDVTGSATVVGMAQRKSAGNAFHTIAAWNYVLSVVAGEYYELMWSTTNHTDVTMPYYAAGSPPPSAASVILTVTQQAGIMAGTGITDINSLTGASQTLTTGTTGTDFAIVDSGVDHKFNLPDASATARGVITTGAQTIAGVKTLSSSPILSSETASRIAIIDASKNIKSADTTTYPSLTELSYGKGVTSAIQTQLNNLHYKNILKDNAFWWGPSGVGNIQTGFSYSPIIGAWAFVLSGNADGTKNMILFASTSTAGTVAFKRRHDGIQLQGLECKITQKIQFQTNISGQRFFCGITKGNQFTAPTNVSPDSLTDIVGVCQMATSTNMQVVYNDASGTATLIDLGTSYPCNDPQYDYFITVEQTTTSYIVTVERVTVATGASISTSNTLTTNIPVYNTGVIEICTWISNNSTAAIASYLDGGGYGTFKN